MNLMRSKLFNYLITTVSGAILFWALQLVTGCGRKTEVHKKANYNEMFMTGSGSYGIVTSIRYGYSEDKLLFVVFESSYAPAPLHTDGRKVQRDADSWYIIKDRWINLPDGTKKYLPDSGAMFEYDCGAFTNQPINLTLPEFQGYLSVRPKSHYSIKTVEEYLTTSRTHPK